MVTACCVDIRSHLQDTDFELSTFVIAPEGRTLCYLGCRARHHQVFKSRRSRLHDSAIDPPSPPKSPLTIRSSVTACEGLSVDGVPLAVFGADGGVVGLACGSGAVVWQATAHSAAILSITRLSRSGHTCLLLLYIDGVVGLWDIHPLLYLVRPVLQNAVSEGSEFATLTELGEEVWADCLWWRLPTQDVFRDIAVVSKRTQLLSVNLMGGLEFPSNPPPARDSTLAVLVAGADPCLGFHTLTPSPEISAERVVSAVSQWLRSRWQPASPTRAGKNRVAEFPLLFSTVVQGGFISDARTIKTLVSDPMSGLAAAVDTYGRVLLLNTSSGLVMRLWKGYRNAEVCFYRPPNALHTAPPHSTPPLCLVIHVPRRGVVEAWTLPMGTQRLWSRSTHRIMQGHTVTTHTHEPLASDGVCLVPIRDVSVVSHGDTGSETGGDITGTESQTTEVHTLSEAAHPAQPTVGAVGQWSEPCVQAIALVDVATGAAVLLDWE